MTSLPLVAPGFVEVQDAPDQAPGQEDHHRHEDSPEDDHLEIVKDRERFGEHGERPGPQERAPDAGHAAQDHHGHQLDGKHEAEGRRCDEIEAVGKEGPGQGGVEGAPDEDLELQAGGVHPQGLSCGLAVVQGPDGPAGAGVHQVGAQGQNYPQNNPDQEVKAPGGVEGEAGQGQGGDAAEARRPPGEPIGLVQDDVHDDAEPEGGHGQVIAPELKGRDAD